MNYILLLLVGMIWGGQFVLIDFSLKSFSPEQLALFRTLYAALFLIVFCLISKKRWMKRSLKDWLKVAMIGVLEVVIPFTLLIWAQQYVSSSMASILMGTIPFFTLILVVLTRVERATAAKFLSISVGFVGLMVLVSPELLSAGFSGALLPQLATLIGALSFASALVVIKSMPQEDAFLLSRDAFVIGTLIMLAITWQRGALSHIYFSWNAFLSSLVLGVFCSGVVYVLYVVLIKRARAGFCSLSNYLVPLFGSVLGVLVLHDKISWNMVVAFVLIMCAVAIEPISQLLNRKRLN